MADDRLLTEQAAPPVRHRAGLSGMAWTYPRFGCRVIAGRDRGRFCEAGGPELALGGAAGNDLELGDPTVSRYHAAIQVTPTGFHVRDLGSTNGTWIHGVRIDAAWIETGAVLRLGTSRVRFEVLPGEVRELLDSAGSLGPLVGHSAVMRGLFGRLQRMSMVDQTMLLLGPPGTGKRLAARTVHERSARSLRPFTSVDAADTPERFGCKSLAAARGGTVFVHEVGELDADGQRALLSLVERSGDCAGLDVRVIVSSSRDLRRDVNQGRFRGDLLRRFQSAWVRMPPLSERGDDVPLLVRALWRELRGDGDARPPDELVERLSRRPWPGNVSQLRAEVARAAAR